MKIKLLMITALLAGMSSVCQADIDDIVLCLNSSQTIYVSVSKGGFQIQDLTSRRVIGADEAGGKLLAALGKVQFDGDQVTAQSKRQSASLSVDTSSSAAPAALKKDFCKAGCNPATLETSGVAKIASSMKVYCQK